MLLDGITLVITPLISLMQDQVTNLKKKGIKAEYINSLMDRELIDITYNKIRNGKVKILFIAGERLESKMFLSVINNMLMCFQLLHQYIL